MEFHFNLPTKVVLGQNVLETLPDHTNHLGRDILLVSSEDLKSYVDKAVSYFPGNEYTVESFLMDSTEPSTNLIDEKALQYKKNNFDCIIGLGGGSAIDMAKSLAISINNPEPIWNYANLSNRPPSTLKKIPISVIAIPTTAGTGSEVTPYAVLTKLDTQQKGTIQQSEIFPKVAIIDPTLHTSLPPHLTAYTGIDAFAHSFESFINISKKSPVSEMVAIESIRLIYNNLKKAVELPDDIEVRLNMAWASTLAGIAIAHRGTTTTHAIAEPLGALTKLPHGLTVVISTLPVIRRTWKHIEEKLNYLANLIFIGENNSTVDAVFFIRRLEELFVKVGVAKPLKELFKIENNFEGLLLENILKYKSRPLQQHPIVFEKDQLLEIIANICYGN